MCGIFGIVGKNQRKNAEKSLNAIKHRGPDDEGQYQDENIFLGFRRLSIIDLSHRGHQPMTNEDSTIWLIFNGEIYNFQELKNQLSSKHKWKSHTDTEVLIHGYEEWGIDRLLQKLSGMFAFCLYDKNKRITYLARDRIGKKPLYYYQNKETLAFSSETKAFFKLSNFDFQIDQDMFNLWMGFPYLPENNKTIIRNVFKVPPASYLTVSIDGKIQLKKYWQLPQKKLNINFQTAQHNLENLLIDAVTKRLISDVPVGVLLSGGIDSSLITAMAAKYSKKKVKTINISFENSAINETSYAQIVADYYKTDHLNLSLKIDDVYGEFKSNIDIYDDLSTADSGLFSEFLLSKKIREAGIKVVLVGEGADEIFAGYSWFQLSQYPFRLLPQTTKAWLYYYSIMRSLPNKNFFHYSNYLDNKLNENNQSFLKKIQAYEIKYSLPNHYCMKVDKATSAASIEARAPYMDYRVVEFASQIPDKYLLNSNFYSPRESNEKYILRKIAEKYLPQAITSRKKKGGMLPVYDFLNHGLKKDKDLILSNPYLIKFYGKKYLTQLINSQPSIKLLIWQREWILWKCLTFSLWHSHFSKLA